MIVQSTVKAKVYPEMLHRACTKAEHAVAIQAERDSRRYIPAASGRLRSSGKVYGRVIVWDQPYARVIYFGNVYVDPKYRKGGFPYPKQGIVRSRRGVQKVSSGRKFNIENGGPAWFYEAKKANIGRWYQRAGEVITRVI